MVSQLRFPSTDPRRSPFFVTPLPQNQGIVTALNTGLKKCKGRYIARMDADDICTPDRLEREVSYLDAHHACDLVGGSVLMFKHGTKLVKVRLGIPNRSVLS